MPQISEPSTMIGQTREAGSGCFY